MTTREIVQGLQYQGADEQIAYTLTTTNWGSTPTSTSAVIKSVNTDGTYTDTTSTNMSGSTSVSGDIITLPTVKSLTAGTLYRVEVKFTSSGSIFEAIAFIQGEL